MRHTPKALDPLDDGSSEWHERRRRGIGGSDAGAVLGISPFVDRQTLWRRKRGVEPPFVGNVHTDYGTLIEPYILEHVRQSVDTFDVEMDDALDWRDLTEVDETWVHPDHEWMLCHVDGRVDGEEMIVEIKSSGRPFDGIPDYHYAQTQHNMEVSGRDRCAYLHFETPFDKSCALELDRVFIDESRQYWQWMVVRGVVTIEIVEYDPTYCERLIERERQFWGHITSETEPPEITPDGEVESDDSVLAELVGQYRQAHETIKSVDQKATVDGRPVAEIKASAESEKSEAKERIKKRMSAYQGDDTPKKVHTPDGYVLWNARGYWQVKV